MMTINNEYNDGGDDGDEIHNDFEHHISDDDMRNWSFTPWLNRERLWVGFLMGRCTYFQNEWMKNDH